MGHGCSSLSKSKKTPIVLLPNPQPIQKESENGNPTKETNHPNPIFIPDDEDKKEEENEKDFGEYGANAVVIERKIERKNSK